MTEPASTSPAPGVLGIRLAAAGLALAVAISIVFAMGTIVVTIGRGVSLVDALVAPIAFVFFAGPALFVMGMALRAKTGAAAAVALVLAALFAVGLEAYEGTPWHFRDWRGNANDAQTQLTIATLFAAWPATLIGTGLWRALNRR